MWIWIIISILIVICVTLVFSLIIEIDETRVLRDDIQFYKNEYDRQKRDLTKQTLIVQEVDKVNLERCNQIVDLNSRLRVWEEWYFNLPLSACRSEENIGLTVDSHQALKG